MRAPKVTIEHRPEGVVIKAEIWRREGTAAARIATAPTSDEKTAADHFCRFVSDLLAEPMRGVVLRQLTRELEITKEVPISGARSRRETPRNTRKP